MKLELTIPSPPRGSYIVEFDLVAEQIAWFSMLGTAVPRVSIQVE